MEQDDYLRLLEAVQDVWNDMYVPSQFVEMLDLYKPIIANPTQKPRSEADKKLVESKKVTLDADIAPRPLDLADEAVKEILSVSENLHLSELETVKLFYLARRRASGGSRGKLTLDVYHMHFSKRFHLLVAIHDLAAMYAREGEILDPSLHSLLHNYFQDLLVNHRFVDNLTALFADLLTRRAPSIQKDNNTEIWLVCKILFYIFQSPSVPSGATSAVGGLWSQIKALLLLLKAHCRDNLTPPKYHSANLVETQAAMELYRERKVAAYMLFFAIHAALSRTAAQIRAWEKPRDEGRIKELAKATPRNEAGLKTLRPEEREQVLAEWSREEFKTLTGTVQFELQQWVCPELKALVQLSWAIFCQRIYDACRQACTDYGNWEPSKDKRNFEEGMIKGLRQSLDVPPQTPQRVFPRLLTDFLKSSRLCDDDQREFINHQVGLFMRDSLEVCDSLSFLVPGRVSVMFEVLSASEAVRNTYPISKEVNSTALLAIITHVIHVSPDLFYAFVNSRAFVSFIQADLGGNSGQLSWSPVDAKSAMFVLYVDLFEAMCMKGEPTGCSWVEDRLKSALNQRLCWEAIRSDLDRFLHQLLPDRLRGRAVVQVSLQQSEEIGNILRLIRAVAAWPGNSLGEMFNKMIELLGCRLHTQHKAEVFKCIAVFAPKRSGLIWQRLEEAQVISTRPRLTDATTAVAAEARAIAPPEGMALELEVESEQKKYRLTTSFISLILTLLCASKAPNHLGSHYRTGGICPYTDFVRENVLKSLFNRNYETRKDLWKLAEVCLAVCVKLLEGFDRSFTVDGSLHHRASDPGYRLLVAILCDGDFMSTLIRIIGEASRQLEETGDKDPETLQHAEASLLFVLRLLSQACLTGTAFISRLAVVEPLLHPEPVGQALLRRCDFSSLNEVVDIGKAIGYIQKRLGTSPQVLVRGSQFEDATELAYHAVSLYGVLCVLKPQAMWALQKLRDSGLQAACYQQLQHNPVHPHEGESNEENKVDTNRTRMALVTFLIDQLASPPPNLAHFLLGFEINDTPSGSVSRLDNSRKSCLDVLLNLVCKPQFAVHNASFAECIFQLFHELASNKDTCSPFIEYTLTFRSDMLFLQMLLKLPTKFTEVVSCLMQRSWLMKTIALELHLAVKRKHAGGASWAAHIDETLVILGVRDTGAVEDNGEMEQGREMKLLELGLLCEVDVHEPAPMPVNIGGVLSSRCASKERGYLQYNLQALRHLCEKEVQSKSEFRSLIPREGGGEGVHTCTVCNNVFTQSSFDPNEPVPTECESCVKLFTGVLRLAREWNEYHERMFAWMSAFDGWKQLVEVLLQECVSASAVPADSEDQGEHIEHCLLELSNFLLRRLINNRDARGWALMGEEVSSLGVTVIAKLRERKESRHESQSAFILDLIIAAILSHVNHVTRMHLYAMFFNCLQYQHEPNAAGVHREGAWESGLDQLREARSRSLRLLTKHADHLVRVVTRDAVEGDIRLRALAFVFLSALLNHQRSVLADYPDSHHDLHAPRNTFLDLLAKQGCIDRMLGELKQRDSLLINAIGSFQYKNYDQILNYESMLSFLVQFASSPRGSRHLIDFEVINSISCCHFLDHRPSNAQAVSFGPFPSPVARHHQLLLPTLALIITMLTASDPDHVGLHTTVLRFLKAHDEVMLSIPLGVILESEMVAPQLESELRVLSRTTLILSFLYKGPLVGHAPTRAELDLSYFKQLRRLFHRLATLSDPHRSANDFAYGPRLALMQGSQQVKEVQVVRDLITEISRNILTICSEKIGRIRAHGGPAMCLFGQRCRFEAGEGHTASHQVAELFLVMERCAAAIGTEFDRSSRKRRGEFQDEKFEMDEKHSGFVPPSEGRLIAVTPVAAPEQTNSAMRVNTALCCLEQALYMVCYHTQHFVEGGKCSEPHHHEKWSEQGVKDYKEKVIKIQDTILPRLQSSLYANRHLFIAQLFKKILATLQNNEDGSLQDNSLPTFTYHLT